MPQTVENPVARGPHGPEGPHGASGAPISGQGSGGAQPAPEPGSEGSETPDPKAGRKYRFRDALKHSSLTHVLLIVFLTAAGLGPRAAEGKLRREAVIVFEAPSVAESNWEPEPEFELEPERELDTEELPEPEPTPVDELFPPTRPEPEVEFAEVADPIDVLRELSQQPIERIEPKPPEPVEVASAEPVIPEPEPVVAEPAAPEPVAMPAEVVRRSPQILASKPPRYPAASYRMGHQGSVLVRITISPEGRVLDVELLKSSGFVRLDQAAMGAVRSWRFQPGTEDGAAATATLDHRLTFRIEG